MASVIVQYTFAVFKCLMSGKHSETIQSLQLQSQTNNSIYDCKDIGLISSHNTVYALTLVYIFSIQTRPDLSSHITKSYIFSSCNRSYSYALIIVWNLLSCETRTKRNYKKKKKNGFLQDVGCSERCGVKFCFLQQQLGKYNHFSQYPALYMKVFYCCRRRHVPQSIL